MPRFRRTTRVLVGIWAGGMVIKILDWVIPWPTSLAAVLAVAASIAGGLIAWVDSRGLAPWTPQDLRDGAIGWGIVAAFPVVATAVLLAPGAWRIPAGLLAAGLTALIATVVYRRAERLGEAA